MNVHYTDQEMRIIARFGVGVYERLRSLDDFIEVVLLEQQVFGDGGGWGPESEHLGQMMRQREELLALGRPPA